MPTAWITGASAGIGWHLACEFATAGYDIVAIARRRDRLEALVTELRSEYKVNAHMEVADLSEPGAPAAVYQRIRAAGYGIQLLANNAGFGDYGPFSTRQRATQSAMIRLNVLALTELTHLCLQDMQAAGRGRILNVASTAAFQPGPQMAVYYATKAYVLHFSEALAHELRNTDITVTTLCPGPVKSEFQNVSGMQKARLLQYVRLPKAQTVAKYGAEACLAGKGLAVHGILNRIGTNGVRLLPRFLATRLSAALTKPT